MLLMVLKHTDMVLSVTRSGFALGVFTSGLACAGVLQAYIRVF